MSHKLIFTFILILSAFSLRSQQWFTDFEVASEEAVRAGLPIVLVFQGSDWCIPCMKLEKEIWESDEFKKVADGNFVMLKADFPRKKKNALPDQIAAANAKLAEQYNKNGIFPLVVVLDAMGNVLGQTGYKRMSPIEYIALLNSFRS